MGMGGLIRLKSRYRLSPQKSGLALFSHRFWLALDKQEAMVTGYGQLIRRFLLL